MIPTYRHSALETYAACPYAYAARLHLDARDDLSGYLCPEGEAWVREHCADAYPIHATNYVTDIGVRFHRFAHAYGSHCQRQNVRSDWSAGDTIAAGIAGRNRDLLNCMTYWAQTWEYDPPQEGGAIALVAGGFEAEQAIEFSAGGRRVRYVWHPDYARISADLKRLEVWDWKSGLGTDRYDPRYAPDQLLRYAWGFSRVFPTLKSATVHLWFVNPSNSMHETPLSWEVDLSEPEVLETLVAAPIASIHATPEFRSEPGCWLCGFCEWAHCCPSEGDVHALLATSCTDAAQALELIDRSEGLSCLLTQRRKLLRKIVTDYVDANGPLDLGDGREYGPVSETVAKVASLRALLDEARERDCDVTFALGLKSGVGALDLARYVGQPDPFSDDDGSPWASIAMATRTRYDVRERQPDEDAETSSDDQADLQPDPGAEAAPAAAAAPAATAAPDRTYASEELSF